MKYLLAIIFTVSSLNISYAALNETEKHLEQYIDNHNNQAIKFLEKIVNINSGTMNFKGVRMVGKELMKKFQAIGMDVKWIDGKSFNRAGHLIAKTKGKKGTKLLLIGHLDTVFPESSPFQKYKLIDKNTVTGPGVADMKGGNVIILQALSALHNAKLLHNMNFTVIMTGDEELSGSPLNLSKHHLIEEAKKADIALGFENGDGNPATANVSRRSFAKWTLKSSGKAAHSSKIFCDKIGDGQFMNFPEFYINFTKNFLIQNILQLIRV